MDELTAKQREALKVIIRQKSSTGMTPTQRELAKLLRVTPTAVRSRLASLERKGYIMLLSRLARGIVIIEGNPRREHAAHADSSAR